MLQKLLSYLIPVTIFKKKSEKSKQLEVTWVNGELVLDSKNTNYSYGSLQRILRQGLAYIGFDHIKNMEHILILGVAGGSVIQTLNDEIKYSGRITGIEIDADVIEIANHYFNLDKYKNVNIIIYDAFEFVLRTKLKYDLIIIDVFEDTHMPAFLFEDYFQNRVSQLLTPGGYILFNTMILCESDNERNLKYIKQFDIKTHSVTTIPRVEKHNELIVIRKTITFPDRS